MTTYRFDIDQAVAHLQKTLMPKMKDAIVRGMHSSALRLEGLMVEEIDTAKPYPAVDTGGLRASIKTELGRDSATVYSDAPYAGAIEFGTRPFRPPLEPIAEWILRKKIATEMDDVQGIAFAIANKMSKEGIKPRHFTKKAVARFLPFLKAEVEREIDAM